MTKKEAIRLLRTEQIGDSEMMELAKHMGAEALERLHTHLIMPKCEKCGSYIPGVEIVAVPELSYGGCILVSIFDPWRCPRCGTFFVSAESNYEEQTCVLRGPKEGEDYAT